VGDANASDKSKYKVSHMCMWMEEGFPSINQHVSL
jgi:hypothetical protein